MKVWWSYGVGAGSEVKGQRLQAETQRQRLNCEKAKGNKVNGNALVDLSTVVPLKKKLR